MADSGWVPAMEALDPLDRDENLGRRALGAYFRSGGYDQPSAPNVMVHNEKEYVVLENSRGVLAVYRVRNDGVLKRLHRWPAALVAGL